MDDMRGQFSDRTEIFSDSDDHDFDEAHEGELPPAAIGNDERRMQVRAYNFWASMLDDRNFPAIEDLDPENEPDFGPYSVLLDFSTGIENPAIAFLGDKLAEECSLEEPIDRLSDVPSRSLLSRITDHYLQIIANQAPIGFEAEFVNQRGSTILYRGILLPFSSDDDTIDFIYGVINWKELADQQTTDELMLQIDQALEPIDAEKREADEMADWADGPGSDPDVLDLGLVGELADEPQDFPEPEFATGDPLDEPVDDSADEDVGFEEETLEELADDEAPDMPVARAPLARPDFLGQEQAEDDDEVPESHTPIDFGRRAEKPALPQTDEQPKAKPAAATAPAGLADWLAEARDLAEVAKASEDRTRKALYAAIGKAYDFSLAATEQPAEFAQILEDAGLTVQDRAPMTPIVKLVFGIDYDKTRLTEYATALTHAHRVGIGKGELAGHLGATTGGLKGLVEAERRHRREESGKPVEERTEVRKALARRLRKLETRSLDQVAAEGCEFTVLVARRMPDGQVVVLGEVADDVKLIERAARKLFA